MKNVFSIAIDGPAGSGKSTIARIIADKLNFKYINSGAFYRAIAYFMFQNDITFEQITDWNEEVLNNVNLKWKDSNIILNGNIINEEVKSNRYSSLASQIAVIPEIRKFVNRNIYSISEINDIVVDGRDIGTVVLPDATVKIFLDADVNTRAKRRFDEIVKDGGNPVDFDTLVNQIIERDNRDYTREIAPLKKPKDAIVLDSSEMSIEQVVEAALRIFYAVASGDMIGE